MRKRERGAWTAVIRPTRGWLELDVLEWWRYRDLIALFVRRNFTVFYKQTILGPAWAVIQPLLTSGIFTVVFGSIAKLGTDGIPEFLFYLCGTVAWSYFAGCLTESSHTFSSNAKVFDKVYFPRIAAPIASVITQLITFCIQFALFLGFLAYYALAPGYPVAPNPRLIALIIPTLLQMALLGLGFGIIVSALTTKYRDLQMLVSFGVQLWMYATPVVYSPTRIPPQFQPIYALNPMAPVINLFRAAFLGTPTYDPGAHLISVGLTIAVLLVGILLFNRIEKTFADTV